MTPVVYTRTADDPNTQADNLIGWSQVYDQISSGGFAGSISGVCLDKIHLFCESTNVSLRQSCLVRSDSWWFGLPAVSTASFRIDSRRIEHGGVAVRRGNRPFELLTPASFEIFGVVIESQAWLDQLSAVHQEQAGVILPRLEAIQIEKSKSLLMRSVLQTMLSEVRRHPELIADRLTRQNMQHTLLDVLGDLWSDLQDSKPSSKRDIQNAKLVQKVRQFVLDQDDRAITMQTVCAAFEISRRKLQYAFEQTIGISPHIYLKTLRLNGARRDLLQSHSGISVQQTAADWGFWHLSQFAKDYRSLFHELPSTTLRRAVGSSC